jgi:hypothetical protein
MDESRRDITMGGRGEGQQNTGGQNNKQECSGEEVVHLFIYVKIMADDLIQFTPNPIIEEYADLFVIGPPPKNLVFMRPEYRAKFMEGLKVLFPDELPTVKFKANTLEGLIFYGPKMWISFYKYDAGRDPVVIIYYFDAEKNDWFSFEELEDPEGVGYEDPNADVIEELLRQMAAEARAGRQAQASPQKLSLKRSVIGWNDPITTTPVRSGDPVIRLNKDNRFVFHRADLERWWVGKKPRDPMTNLPVAPHQIERFVAEVVEDAGDEPMNGGRRRKRLRKTMRRKNLRSTRKNK